ncbi:MAG TPA: GNAT family N-acetyltransferase [Methylomirabilota bacterium]|nr:GNAT family N-acetyltransferase [Methylomirabilota bacterium]
MSAGTAPALRIVPATEADVPVLLAFIRKLAEYEKLADEVEATEEHVRSALFGPNRVAEALLAFFGGEPVAFAVFFHNFSTFLGRPGIYLEDLFVDPPQRGKGIGKALLVELARLARARNCGRLEWAVLDWNESAIEFYRSLGAVAMDDWTIFRLTGDALARLAEGEPS